MKWLMSAAELSNSPSRRDGMSFAEEKKALRQTMWFVQEVAKELKLPPVAVMTAQTFLNRFYALQSFLKYDRFVAAQACLFLAAKVEESPTKLHKIVTTARAVRGKDEGGGQQQAPFVAGSAGFEEAKNEVLSCERAVLYTIGYDVDVTAMSPISPFSDILARLLKAGVVPPAKEQSFGQSGIKFISDSLRTNLCLQFEPKKIASGCALLAVVFLRLYPGDKDTINALFKVLSISERTIKTICATVVELYVDVDKCKDLIADLKRFKWIPDDLNNLGGPTDDAAGANQQPHHLRSHSQATVSQDSPVLPSPAHSSPLYLKPTTPPPPVRHHDD
mmetsp:Transcript_32977/g.105225  ORF Transcript_32977/g.105225 Transcript_32977/m.105225 type:complete len:333 (-) Transcript_32977:165-1163(-)